MRKMSDLRNTLEATSRSFDAAIEEAQNREVPKSKTKSNDDSAFLISFSQFLKKIGS